MRDVSFGWYIGEDDIAHKYILAVPYEAICNALVRVRCDTDNEAEDESLFCESCKRLVTMYKLAE